MERLTNIIENELYQTIKENLYQKIRRELYPLIEKEIYQFQTNPSTSDLSKRREEYRDKRIKAIIQGKTTSYYTALKNTYTHFEKSEDLRDKVIAQTAKILAGDYQREGKTLWKWEDRITEFERIYPLIAGCKYCKENLKTVKEELQKNKYAKSRFGKEIKKICQRLNIPRQKGGAKNEKKPNGNNKTNKRKRKKNTKRHRKKNRGTNYNNPPQSQNN